MPKIDIVETKNIIRLVNERYDFDLSHLVITSLRYKLDYIINRSGLRDPDHLYEMLNGDPEFYDTFISEVFYASTELFRDPEMWILLKDKYIPELIEKFGNISIHICHCSCGSDLYSAAILVKEMQLSDKVHIDYSWLSKRTKENINQGKIERNLPELSAKNIKIVFPDYHYDKYIIPKDKMFFFDNQLLQAVSSRKYNSRTPDDPNFHLILCRNRLLFFNLHYQNLMLDKHVRELEKEGIIVLGFREDISDYRAKNQSLEELDSVEKIYRKIKQ